MIDLPRDLFALVAFYAMIDHNMARRGSVSPVELSAIASASYMAADELLLARQSEGVTE